MVLRVDPERKELLAHLGSGQAIDQSITRNRVMGRVEHQVSKVGHVEFFIEEQVIKAHCVAMSFGYDRFKQQIAGTPAGSRQTISTRNTGTSRQTSLPGSTSARPHRRRSDMLGPV